MWAFRSQRARRSWAGRAPRFSFELLETRALLSGVPLMQPAHAVAAELPSDPFGILHAEVETAVVIRRQLVVVPVTVVRSSPDLPPTLVEVPPVLQIGPTAPMVVFIGPRAASLLPPQTIPRDPTGSPTAPATTAGLPSQATINQQAESRDVGQTTTANPPPTANQPPAQDVNPVGPQSRETTASTAPESVAAPAPPPALVPPVAYLPAPASITSRQSQIEGTLDSGEQSESITIPVGSTTQSLGLFVHSDSSAAGGAVFGKLTLEDSAGNPIEQVGPTWGPGSGPPQALAVALNGAPAGGRLVIQITTSENASSGPSDTGVPAASGVTGQSVPFVLEVQRLDVESTGTVLQTDSAGDSRGVVGSLVTTIAPSASTEASVETTASPAEGQGVSSATDGPSVSSSSIATAAGSASGTLDDLSGMLQTGPLASRTAGPLGPILANLGTDLTPQVDRYERALMQEIDNAGTDDVAGDTGGAFQVAQTESPTSTGALLPGPGQQHRADEPVVAVTGAGGFRLKVTGLGGAPHAASAALLAALPNTSESEAQPSVAASDSVHDTVPELTLAAGSAATDRGDYPDFLRAACGLALGLGLATGPLFADLIASALRRAPRWRKTVRSRATTAQAAPASDKPQNRGVRAWARRLVASR
jgi:hypothetical protein